MKIMRKSKEEKGAITLFVLISMLFFIIVLVGIYIGTSHRTQKQQSEIEKIQKEYETFSNYIWSFTNNKIIYEVDKTSSELSDIISKDLQKRGMKFVGSTIIYAYLQAIGVIYSHDKECFMYKDNLNNKL